MRVAVLLAVAAASAMSALGAAYDDFSRGLQANSIGNSDLAISSFTSALNAGDLAATYVSSAYLGRAIAYTRKAQCAEAEADLDSALKLRPAYLEAITMRAAAKDCQNKYEDARTDLDAAIKLSPTTELYRNRGQFFWRHAQYEVAAADFLKAAEVAPTSAYNAPRRAFSLLWYAITAARAGSFEAVAFAKAVDKADLDGWPEPVLNYFLGKLKREELYAKAARGDGQIPAQQKCEADFYLGEWQIAHSDPAGKSLIQQAENECPRDFIEYSAARTELKRLP